VSADGRVAILALMTPGPPEDRATMAYVRRLRALSWPELESAGLQVQWGGFAAVLTDFDHELFGRLPWVALAVIVLTFGVLAWLFKSIVLPLKATLLNTVSVLAAYGFLVLVFQEGRGAEWIGLDPPGGLNAFVVVMLFTILFGLSMDYEVFLISRMREAYDETGSTDKAIELGLARTGKLVTSGALILMFAFLVLSSTPGFEVKSLAIGIAAGIIVDATVIRALLVPATMRLLGDANWWMPRWTETVLRIPRPAPPVEAPATHPAPRPAR
jgi:RND superfamily putative drug exporter